MYFHGKLIQIKKHFQPIPTFIDKGFSFRKIWTRILSSKRKETIEKAFEDIFLGCQGWKPEKIETDQAKEFTSLKTFFSKNDVFYKIKRGWNKSSVAEAKIFEVKKRLYSGLR